MNAKRIDRLRAAAPIASFLGRFRPGPTAAILACFVVSAIVAGAPSLSPTGTPDDSGFEVGEPADRDVIARRTVIFIDEDATRLRREAQERLVPAVFRYSATAAKESLDSFAAFSARARELFEERVSADAFRFAIQADFPGAFQKDSMDALYRNPGRTRLLDDLESVLRIVISTGIVALPEGGLDGFNPDAIEVVRKNGGGSERERVSIASLAVSSTISAKIAAMVKSGSYPAALDSLASAVLSQFANENIFYSAEDSVRRLEAARSSVEPVMKRIEKGESVVRKGFIVSKTDFAALRAMGGFADRDEGESYVGKLILLELSFALMIFLAGQRVVGRLLQPSEVYLIAAASSAYLIGAAFASGLEVPVAAFPSAVFLPTALLVMLPAVLMGPRVAAALSICLPLAAFVVNSFDASSFFFALASGAAGAFVLQGAERRMDLVRAGAIVAAAQLVAAAGILLALRSDASVFPSILFWSAFNGFASGMTVLGLLPLLEQALNAATPFRLIELSDLNSPMLKRLLTIAPGTYSHSVTVANLAESACREIGANSLLARVGAYYHDIGKMDQPEYFIENQAAYNKHDDLAPRLSATVIRSHVKIGMEKARRMGLPLEVVDIIAEHHGNSVISWFYNEALKREDQVKADDFSYPGSPPRSKESAVVMLADSVEAAVRSMKKPTMSRLDKFVQELIMSKFEQGQLSESELTFKDLEAIKNSFVRVLAGHYHSRIEYPKAREAVG
ncbi:MAG: phosphohydrolase [Treponema sp. GWB1_62_6]|nr:MAG: phosphohydrolase [Treponema sp. GWB1_62_6]